MAHILGSSVLDSSSGCVISRLAAAGVSLFDPESSNPIREQYIRHLSGNNFLPLLETSNCVIVRLAAELRLQLLLFELEFQPQVLALLLALVLALVLVFGLR